MRKPSRENLVSQTVVIGDLLLCLSMDTGIVNIWNHCNGRYYDRLSNPKSMACCCERIPNHDNLVAIGYENGEILLWDLLHPSEHYCSVLDRSSIAHQIKVRQMDSVSAAIPLLVSCSDDESIKIWNFSRFSYHMNTKHLRSTILLDKVFKSPKVTCCCISRDGTELVSGSEDCSIRLWNVEDESEEEKVLLGHVASITVVKFHSKSSFLLSGAQDETIRIWNCSNGACLMILSSFGVPRDLLLFENNLCLVFCSWVQCYLWNIFHGQCLTQVATLEAIQNDSFQEEHIEPNKNSMKKSLLLNNDDKVPITTDISVKLDCIATMTLFVPLRNGAVLQWKWNSLLKRWKEFVPLQELVENAPQDSMDNEPIRKDTFHQYPTEITQEIESVRNQWLNRELVLRWREQRLNTEKQFLEEQKMELESWASSLEATKRVLEDLYRKRVESLEQRTRLLDSWYEQISKKRQCLE
eukprot:jgi/Galph1/409/GphlegSOOS_G5171.1